MSRKHIVMALVAALLSAGAARAASLEVGPTLISLSGKERTATLTVRNAAQRPVRLQIRTMDWAQSAGDDRYTPATTLVASPPQFELAAGQSQTVRIAVEGVGSASAEKAWRVFVDELPEPRGQSPGVAMPLRLLIPVFLAPNATSRAAIRWSARRQGTQVVVSAENTGPAHERLMDLSFQSPGGAAAPAVEDGSGYLLSGASRSWTVPAGQAASLTATANGASGPIRTEISVN